MGRIIVSRELSYYHGHSPIKVYVNNRIMRRLEREGDVQEIPIAEESVEVRIKEWGFKTKPVTVKSGQTVLIKPRLPLVFLSYACFIAWLLFWYRWYQLHPWPGENWDSPFLFWHNTWRTLLIWLPFWLNRLFLYFTLEVKDDLPKGYFPEKTTQ